MKYPAPTRKDHQRFCETEGWEERKSATNSRGDHVRYELLLADGRILYTRISHPVSKVDTYGPKLWGHILKDQLEVDEVAFWDCVRESVLPLRGGEPPAPRDSIPAGVVAALLGFGIAEHEVRAMSRSDAIKRLAELYSEST